MNALHVAQTFLRQCRRDASISGLAMSFQHALASLGFRCFACWSHVDPLRPPADAVVLHNYPRDWIQRYSESRLYAIDPVSLWASHTLVPFFWDEEAFCARLTAAQQSVLAMAGRHGIAHGYTIPIHGPHDATSHPASCTVIPTTSSLPPEHYAVVQLMALPLFDAARSVAGPAEIPCRVRSLSERERECLTLAAQGKSDWAVGRILGISERTVHNHIENAKRRLRVTTRVQAIVHGLASGQIVLRDVLRRNA